MVLTLQHELRPEPKSDELARQRFVSGIRSFILNDLAADMRTAYDRRIRGQFEQSAGRAPNDGVEVHKAMRGDPAFNIYSAMRVHAQKMVWASVIPLVEREAERLETIAASVKERPGTVSLNPDLPVPRNVSSIDVHLLPGSYVRGGDQLAAGAIYDQGLAVFSMGLMGRNLDDIGLSMSTFIKEKFPDFEPARILDLGCTVGHNTLPWKQAYPSAEVHAIDVAAPGLLYGSARAKLQGQEVQFEQMSADALEYDDESFDFVFSSMFLHELSDKVRRKVFEEAYRVLRAGGLMLHMELPPNDQLSPFESFYLDWDSYYNEEPFYKGYRDKNPAELCERAGFRPEDYFQFVTPSIGLYGPQAVAARARGDEEGEVDEETTGRLADGVQWFGYGAWKK